MADICNAAKEPNRANYGNSQQKRQSVPTMGTDCLVLVSPKLKPQTVAHSVCGFSKLYGYWFAATTTIGYLKKISKHFALLNALTQRATVVNAYASYSIIPENSSK